jgi:GAF domain-containing protein
MPSEVSMSGAGHDREPTVEDLKGDLAAARQREAATAEILRVISETRTDIQPVFDTIVKSAVRLCDGLFSGVYRFDGELLHHVAHYNYAPEALAEIQRKFPTRPARDFGTGRAVIERATIHIPDVEVDPEYRNHPLSRAVGMRSGLFVPMLRDGAPLGAIVVARADPGPFSDKEIELLQTFADQAVIAIENTRLFEAEQASKRELRGSLEYQTAISDVLSVISRSPSDLGPVLEAIGKIACRLCVAYDVSILLRRGDKLHRVFMSGPIGGYPLDVRLTRGLVAGRAVMDAKPVHVADLRAETREFPEGSARAEALGHRTILAVPLLQAGQAIGTIVLRRLEVHPFAPNQVVLLKTFADQAVIAIENTRLFEAEQARTKELQARTRDLAQSLEYQTATGEVLNIISRSPSELQHVLDAIVAMATRLCEGFDAIIFLKEGDRLRVGVHHGDIPLGIESMPLGRGWATGRAVIDCAVIHVHDFAVMREEFPEGHQQSARDGVRTGLAVPLLREGDAIGAFMIRRKEVRPFSDKQIELLKTFADQAVIAIENTRLFEDVQARTKELEARTKELQESLEYQTATSDVLGVISRSPNQLQPVLDTIVETAFGLCPSDGATIMLREADRYRFVASAGFTPEEITDRKERAPVPVDRGSVVGRVALEGRTIHVHDVKSDPDYTHWPSGFRRARRTVLGVPLVRDGSIAGVIILFRAEVEPYSQRQIELVETFADQAVIAIENTRLFEEVQARTRELSESLEQQTATSEILRAISSSPGELAPVFNAILENATRLCETKLANLFLHEKGIFRIVGMTSPSSYPDWWRRNPIDVRDHPDLPLGRLAATKRVVHSGDLTLERDYVEGHRHLRTFVEAVGARTLLLVPMLKERELVGAIAVYRQEVRPFSDKQIELVESFASQAVIAVENARLFEEVQARNRDLTALGEVGRAVSSTLDLKLVLKTIVDRAIELSSVDGGSIYHFRNGRFELGETTGFDEEAIARFRELDISAGQTGLGEAIARREPLQIPDILSRPSNSLRDAAIEAGLRAALIVPLLGGEEPLGALVLQRRQPGEFAPAVVSLMQSFADQSAIALENARLFEEIAWKSRELEIASQHKSQFVANMSHELRTPLAAILGYAELMQEGFYEAQGPKSLDALTRIRSNGKHLLGLINTVLDIAKIESGQFTLNMAEYAIESVVETVRSATESLAQNKKLALMTEVAMPLPVGVGDEQRLTQVLLNLVGNAIKFTDAGEVRVTARTSDGHFNVSVSDTGPGIPAEHQTRIFEQFQQVDNSNTRAKGGTGLGLAIAKQIVEMHGGRIWVESTLGKGSTFQMELPTHAQFHRRTP